MEETMDPDVELLKRQMADVRLRLGGVAAAVDDNPWITTHSIVSGKIKQVGDTPAREVLEDFMQIIGILNAKMVNIFAALGGVAPADPQFLELLAAERARVVRTPEAVEETTAAIAALSDTLRSVVAAHYHGYLDGTLTTAVGDLHAAVASLP
jgi:hypothetical protein